SLDLVRKYPLARSRIFLRLARRLVPRFTRGIAVLLFYFVWRLEVRRPLPLGISEARPLHAPLRCVSLRRLGYGRAACPELAEGPVAPFPFSTGSCASLF